MTKVGVHTKHGVLHFSSNASKNQFLTGKIYSCHVSVWETSWIYILPHHVKEYLRPSLISCSTSQRDWLANFIQIGLNLKIMNMHVNAKFLFYWHFSRHGEHWLSRWHIWNHRSFARVLRLTSFAKEARCPTHIILRGVMTQVLPTRTSYFLRSPKQSMIDIKNCLFGTLSILNNIKQRAIRTNHKTKFRRCLNIPSPLRSALKPGHRPINNIWDKPSTLQQKEDSIFINILNRISINILNYIFFFWVPVEFCFPFDCYNSDFAV